MATKHKKTFYLKNGKTFSNLRSFAKELAKMPKDVYEHHVNKNKNDFHNWVKHSIKHEDLANKIKGEIDKIELEIHVLRELLFPTKKKNTKTGKKKSSSKKKIV